MEADGEHRDRSPNTEPRNSQPEEDPPSTSPVEGGGDRRPPVDQAAIFKALEVVERDSLAIAESFTSLFASLRLALSEVTSCSVDHMQCFSDAAGHLQESVLDSATKGNRYINSCLRLNEEMKGIENLGTELKILRRNVDALDTAVNRIVRLP
ncbi:uncharacterized protein LOC116202337 [Punica granatum]|uniref:BLOC-1-related complex subunit 6 C-terminal helix domain-containing protein n=2 Tax=Punica granatum TaxID=22663 RepID=A0A218XKB5_PUNGR|nr:uncharacterized protein LOC116202337 [Punica granatum]OWM85314.1 hypothetical protein CDL15_Pgr028101 [Punica granatum]PKI50957.1 hypothetical protein CRG98_028687 [Punica granatum]